MKQFAMALAMSMSLFCATPVLAQAPTLVNFQGKLTDANQAPVDGSADIVCSVYDAAAGGTLLWSEEYPGVPVSKGIFNVLLGNGYSNTAAIPGPVYAGLGDVFAATPEAWLEVEVAGEIMSPRQRLVSVAYSLHAQTAVAADDVPGKDITPNSLTIPAYGQVIDSLGQWTGATIPSAKLDETDPQVEAATINRLSKWNGSALVDSTSINETATGYVGIGTEAPTEKLSVAGKVQTSGGFVFPDGSQQTTAGVITESDPTVDATVKDGVSWPELQEKPADLADGQVNWNEVKDIPAGFADGTDDGLLAETDPQVEAATANRLPKWNGSALVDSASINETATGNVGIGTAAPTEKLSVAGKVQTSGGIVFPDGSEQATAAVITESDPTVDPSVKDGVSWAELQEKPADLADGQLNWTEVKDIPPGFDDGTDDGLLAETDPQVEAATANRLPKWDGTALVDSASINETATGNVGIGTTTPIEKLSVAGKIQTSGGIVFSDGSEQVSAGVITEADPTVDASVKDGVSWAELQHPPPDLADGQVNWAEVRDIPAGFADGIDDGLITETDPTVPASIKDGISWSEVSGIPAGFADGIDNVGITSETDPQVGAISTNRIPKWNGSALVNSSSINESAAGKVGIGTTNPQSQLDVAGDAKISGVLSSGKIQIVDVVTEGDGCNQNGLVARNASGLILSCQSGVWKMQHTGATSSTVNVSYSGGNFYAATANCPVENGDDNRIEYSHIFNLETQSLLIVTLSGKGLCYSDANTTETWSSVFSSIYIDGIRCASDRGFLWEAPFPTRLMESAVCSKTLDPGPHTVSLCPSWNAIKSELDFTGSVVLQ